MSDAPYGERRNPSPRFLPPDPSVSAPYRLTPGLAVRVGVLGIVAIAVFALLFFRLWSLQVLSGARYLDAAQNNQLRTIRVEAPRGPILDREGKVIVGERARHRGQALGRRHAEEGGALPDDQAPRDRARRADAAPCPRGRRARHRPAHADHGQDGGARRPGLLPPGARVGVPRRPDPADLPAQLPVPVPRRAGPRVRGRDLAVRAEGQGEGAEVRLPRRRQDRQVGGRGQVRRSTSTARPERLRSASTRAGGRRARSRSGGTRSRGWPCG